MYLYITTDDFATASRQVTENLPRCRKLTFDNEDGVYRIAASISDPLAVASLEGDRNGDQQPEQGGSLVM